MRAASTDCCIILGNRAISLLDAVLALFSTVRLRLEINQMVNWRGCCILL